MVQQNDFLQALTPLYLNSVSESEKTEDSKKKWLTKEWNNFSTTLNSLNIKLWFNFSF